MSEIGWLLLYSSLVLLVSLFGGYLPFRKKVTHSNLQLYLSVSAGVMLGASFFHLMPDAMELSKGLFGWWMSLGVVGLFCIERFIAPHSHEVVPAGTKITAIIITGITSTSITPTTTTATKITNIKNIALRPVLMTPGSTLVHLRSEELLPRLPAGPLSWA